MSEKLKTYISELRELESKASKGPWTAVANIPFYAVLNKPSPSLSKHDSERPEYWNIDDVKFVLQARNELSRLLDLLERAVNEIETIKKYFESCGYDDLRYRDEPEFEALQSFKTFLETDPKKLEGKI